jgi:hypothetical protein
VGATEVSLGEQTVVRAAQHSKIFERGAASKRMGLLMVHLQERTAWAAVALAIHVGALEVVTSCDRS